MIERLQVYKSSYDLTQKLYKIMPEMERCHRYTIGSRILDCALEMFKWITLANSTKDATQRLNYLDGACTNFQMLRVYIKMCSDFKLVKPGSLAMIFILIEDISKQLLGWRKSTENRTTERV